MNKEIRKREESGAVELLHIGSVVRMRMPVAGIIATYAEF